MSAIPQTRRLQTPPPRSPPLAVFWAKRHDVARRRRMMIGPFYGRLAINMFSAFIPARTMWRLFFG